jgi:hypothetical protein
MTAENPRHSRMLLAGVYRSPIKDLEDDDVFYKQKVVLDGQKI